MPLLPLRSIHGWMVSSVEFHHRPWKTYTIRPRRAWHAIIAIGKNTRSDNIKRRMTLSPLGSTHNRKASIMKCHHLLWTTHTVVQYWVWNAFIAFGLHTLSDDVRRCMTAWALGSINGQMTSDFTCHYRPWVSHTV